jgi:predicted  nucleic acid-binding Zn ribbon protein
MGDYQVHNDTQKNSLFTEGAYNFKRQRSVITHREYITDIVTSSTAGAFSYVTYSINPGQDSLFPWLSNIAQCFEAYKMHGLVFEYKSMSADALNSTNTALGQVILSV